VSASTRNHSDCLPIIQHRHKVSLERFDAIGLGQSSNLGSGMFQSGGLLPAGYGSSLHTEVRNSDAMYALTEVFTFVANSENQFLNFMESHVDDEIEATDQRMELTVANLEHTKSLLDDHANRLDNILFLVTNRGSSRWPRTETHIGVAEEAISTLSIDFKSLLKRSGLLAKRCVDGIEAIGSNAQLEEARKAIQEAEQTRRLTLLAFFYLPLTFTTSIFGMNIRELGQGDKSIWISFVTGFVVLVLSSVAYSWRSLRRIVTGKKQSSALSSSPKGSQTASGLNGQIYS
jgi:Mg2+ and Co2+ transporter CorA